MTDPSRVDRGSLTALVVASMIGAGVYSTSGFAIGDLGSPWAVMAAWAIGGIIATSGAISYSLLAAKITENGGEYLHLSRSVHPIAGVIVGWISLLAGFTGAGAFAAVAFESYALGDSAPPGGMPSGVIAVGLVALMTAMHLWDAKPLGFSRLKSRPLKSQPPKSQPLKSRPMGLSRQNAMVLLKLGLVIMFIVIAFGQWDRWSIDPTRIPTQAALPDPWKFMTTVMWISLSFSGFNAAIYLAGEADRGERDLKWSMIGGTVFVSLIYLALNTIFVFAPATDAIAYQENVATIAAESIGGWRLALWVRIMIGLGLATSVSSLLVAGPRVYARMADDGYLPSWFSQQGRSPKRGILFQGIAIAAVSLVAGISELLSYLGMTLSLSAAATVATLFLPGDRSDSFQRSFIQKAIAAFFIFATVVVAAISGWNKPHEAIAATATVGIGIAAWFFQRFK